MTTSHCEIEIEVPLRDIPASMVNPDEYLNAWIRSADGNVPYRILRKSVDARKRSYIKLLYRLDLNPQPLSPGLPEYPVPGGITRLKHPLVIGCGPAGLLAGYLLALKGCEPIILERGERASERLVALAAFHTTRKLNPESNYLFGEGGAGTCSDGKLYTRIRDERCDFILRLFAFCGAPHEIVYLQRPHIGSDRLPGMVERLRGEIEQLGGTFAFGTKAEKLWLEQSRCRGVVLASGERLEAPAVLVAAGHSARPLIRSMTGQGIEHTLKSFQVGCRVEHTQRFVNQMQYGQERLPPALPIPEYHITSRPARPDLLTATSFCMCPGGEIIPAVHEEGRLCTNGMSPYGRDMRFANAAVIVSLENEFRNADAAFGFMEDIETASFSAGGGDWVAPGQGIEAFIRGEKQLSSLESSYRMGLRAARVDQCLPPVARASLSAAFRYFSKRYEGFGSGKVVGVETRISSPVRFTRDPERLSSVSVPNLWLAGEGAGYAGGIVSAAVDGLRLAEKMIASY